MEVSCRQEPLPADVAELLRHYLEGKPAGRPLWGGTWARDRKGAEMLRLDLAAAGIPYMVPGPDGPLFADFHALRHSYLTLGGRAGIDLLTLQKLAGHSTPTLTARYSHRGLDDLAGAVDKLPSILPAAAAAPDVFAPCLRISPAGAIDGRQMACIRAAWQGLSSDQRAELWPALRDDVQVYLKRADAGTDAAAGSANRARSRAG